jgi:hypothetical protein
MRERTRTHALAAVRPANCVSRSSSHRRYDVGQRQGFSALTLAMFEDSGWGAFPGAVQREVAAAAVWWRG